MKKLLLIFAVMTFTFSNQANAQIFTRYADYDGDGRKDHSTWNSRNGIWTITYKRNGKIDTVQTGTNGDIPVPADYDGDGRAEVAVWRPSDGKWYISLENRTWKSTRQKWVRQMGKRGDIPLPGNYDHDRAHEIAVYRPSTGHCYISTANKSWKHKGRDYKITQEYRCGRY